MGRSARGAKSSNSNTTLTLRSIFRENVEHGRWNEEIPREYMTFLTNVEEVDIEDFGHVPVRRPSMEGISTIYVEIHVGS